MARLDPHSYNDTSQPDLANLDWTARVDFDSRTISALAKLSLARPGSGPLDLDTRDLRIEEATLEDGTKLDYQLGETDPILGTRLRVTLPPNTRTFQIRYSTSPTASALQWLSPAQTSGGKHPFLFSQCQAIHARSVVPLQDTPRVRIRFTAELTVPVALRALMAAAFVTRRQEGGSAIERYEMPQPIPSYLFAFAVGELLARDLGPRSRVWAEPSVVDAAAWEFAGVDDMLTTAEAMFGPYEWDRFDILAMPPSFPYGGMENPRLTFLTPTLLAGDRSMVNVVAHELAHSWTGNLVTNATGDHFWLNEGFTVFAERRIQKALEGDEICGLHAALGRQHLEQAIGRFADRPELTKLHTDLRGIDPDDAYSEVPYEKGYLFLRTIEEAVGSDAFTQYLRRYVETYRFQSITTADFIGFTEQALPGVLVKVGADEWIEGVGIPENAPALRSTRLERLEQVGSNLPDTTLGRSWTPTEWSLYLESLPRTLSAEKCSELDRRFALTKSRNYEVLVSWLALAAEAGHELVLPRVEEVLGKVGRMKYLKPLYLALAKRPDTRAAARRIFAESKAGYHPIAQQVIEGVLKKEGA